jgi:hypothetical protein
MNSIWKSPWLWLGVAAAAIGLTTLAGPAEKSLGVNVRVVYLHGAWVWAALALFIVAGAVGLTGIALRRVGWQRWSRALGRAGLLFWITYLPISMWAMQTNWNGLYLAEPRFRFAVIFAVAGLLLQIGVTLLEDPRWASAGNLGFILILLLALQATPNVMHPSSPIFSSDARRIQLFFVGLNGLMLLAAWQTARLWQRAETAPAMDARS